MDKMNADEFFKAMGMKPPAEQASELSPEASRELIGKLTLALVRGYVMSAAAVTAEERGHQQGILEHLRKQEAEHGHNVIAYDQQGKFIMMFTMDAISRVSGKVSRELGIALLFDL